MLHIECQTRAWKDGKRGVRERNGVPILSDTQLQLVSFRALRGEPRQVAPDVPVVVQSSVFFAQPLGTELLEERARWIPGIRVHAQRRHVLREKAQRDLTEEPAPEAQALILAQQEDLVELARRVRCVALAKPTSSPCAVVSARQNQLPSALANASRHCCSRNSTHGPREPIRANVSFHDFTCTRAITGIWAAVASSMVNVSFSSPRTLSILRLRRRRGPAERRHGPYCTKNQAFHEWRPPMYTRPGELDAGDS